jgi:hypothetical protein
MLRPGRWGIIHDAHIEVVASERLRRAVASRSRALKPRSASYDWVRALVEELIYKWQEANVRVPGSNPDTPLSTRAFQGAKALELSPACCGVLMPAFLF